MLSCSRVHSQPKTRREASEQPSLNDEYGAILGVSTPLIRAFSQSSIRTFQATGSDPDQASAREKSCFEGRPNLGSRDSLLAIAGGKSLRQPKWLQGYRRSAPASARVQQPRGLPVPRHHGSASSGPSVLDAVWQNFRHAGGDADGAEMRMGLEGFLTALAALNLLRRPEPRSRSTHEPRSRSTHASGKTAAVEEARAVLAGGASFAAHAELPYGGGAHSARSDRSAARRDAVGAGGADAKAPVLVKAEVEARWRGGEYVRTKIGSVGEEQSAAPAEAEGDGAGRAQAARGAAARAAAGAGLWSEEGGWAFNAWPPRLGLALSPPVSLQREDAGPSQHRLPGKRAVRAPPAARPVSVPHLARTGGAARAAAAGGGGERAARARACPRGAASAGRNSPQEIAEPFPQEIAEPFLVAEAPRRASASVLRWGARDGPGLPPRPPPETAPLRLFSQSAPRARRALSAVLRAPTAGAAQGRAPPGRGDSGERAEGQAGGRAGQGSAARRDLGTQKRDGAESGEGAPWRAARAPRCAPPQLSALAAAQVRPSATRG